MCTIVMIAALLTLNCPTPVASPAQAAAILAGAPGLSNRTNVWTPAPDERRSGVFVPVSTPAATVQKVERESDTARAIRMGIPGGWTPLEFATLNGGR